MSRVVLGADAVVTDAAPHARVQGVDPAYPQIWSATLARGAFFTAEDATAANRVAVLGQTLALSLFPDGQPLGKMIRIRSQPFTVVGVLAGDLDSGAADADNTVLIPFQTGQVRLFGTRSAYELLLRVPDGRRASAVGARVQQVLRQRHRLAAGQQNDFTIQTDSITEAGAGQTRPQAGVRAIQLVEQYACRVKALCAPSPAVR